VYIRLFFSILGCFCVFFSLFALVGHRNVYTRGSGYDHNTFHINKHFVKGLKPRNRF